MAIQSVFVTVHIIYGRLLIWGSQIQMTFPWKGDEPLILSKLRTITGNSLRPRRPSPHSGFIGRRRERQKTIKATNWPIWRAEKEMMMLERQSEIGFYMWYSAGVPDLSKQQEILEKRSDNPCFDDALYHDSFGNHSLSVTTRIDFPILLPSGNNKRPTELGRRGASLPFHATGCR